MPARPRPTIHDVARRAAVSIATVSAVLNRAAWVPSDTRRRVLDAVEAIGYRPNLLARSLKLRRSFTVGVVVSDVANPFFTEVTRSLGRVLRDHGRTVLLCDADQDYQLGAASFQMLLEKRVDALVLMGDSVHPDLVAACVEQDPGIPIVAIERDYELPGVDTLLVDSEAAGFEATTHLARQGRRRIAMIHGPRSGPGSTDFGSRARFDGYRRALAEAGLSYDETSVAEGNTRYDGGQQAMRHLLDRPDRPDALFTHNDLTALGAIEVIHAAGLAVPDDVAVVGFDDIPMAAHTAPGLTTMAMPTAAFGEAAAERLLDRLDASEPLPPLRRFFEATLIVRGSSVAALPAWMPG